MKVYIMRTQQDEKIHYSQCVILVFNQDDKNKLSSDEKLLLKAMQDKWRLTQNDPNGERIHIIYIGQSDLDRKQNKNFSENPKFAPMKNIDPYSHVYILGHHYIENNEYQISDSQDGDKRVDFPMSNVAKLFLDCIEHTDVCLDRSNLHLINNSIENQKMKISLVLCDSATGYLEQEENDEGEVENIRDYLDSMASNFLKELLNSNPTQYLDCIVTGVIGYVYPTIDTRSSNTSLHKLYKGRLLTVDGEIFMTPAGEISDALKEAGRESDKWKLTFTAAPNTTEADIRNRKIKVVYETAETWKQAINIRISNKNQKIQHDLGLFREHAKQHNLPDAKDLESQIENGIIDYTKAIKIQKKQ